MAFQKVDDKDGDKKRYNRIKFTLNKAGEISYGFLCVTLALLSSVVYLLYCLTRGRKSLKDLPEMFETEAKNLLCILSLFCLTYMLRFSSDKFVIENLA